jgi:hypothetical protein
MYVATTKDERNAADGRFSTAYIEMTNDILQTIERKKNLRTFISHSIGLNSLTPLEIYGNCHYMKLT